MSCIRATCIAILKASVANTTYCSNIEALLRSCVFVQVTSILAVWDDLQLTEDLINVRSAISCSKSIEQILCLKLIVHAKAETCWLVT